MYRQKAVKKNLKAKLLVRMGLVGILSSINCGTSPPSPYIPSTGSSSGSSSSSSVCVSNSEVPALLRYSSWTQAGTGAIMTFDSYGSLDTYAVNIFGDFGLKNLETRIVFDPSIRDSEFLLKDHISGDHFACGFNAYVTREAFVYGPNNEIVDVVPPILMDLRGEFTDKNTFILETTFPSNNNPQVSVIPPGTHYFFRK